MLINNASQFSKDNKIKKHVKLKLVIINRKRLEEQNTAVVNCQIKARKKKTTKKQESVYNTKDKFPSAFVSQQKYKLQLNKQCQHQYMLKGAALIQIAVVNRHAP